jgi:hypothetical protein
MNMLEDLPLFQRHSITSRAAAESLTPTTVNACQRRLLDYLADHPEGATDEQMQLGIPMPPSTQRPRRIELVAKGMIVQAGEGKTRSGRRAVKWRVAFGGRKATCTFITTCR